MCVLAVGKMVEAAEEAADLLEARGISATVWDVRVVPLDTRMLADAGAHRLVVTVEDGIAEGGVGSTRRPARSAGCELGGRAPPVVTLGTPLAYLPHGKPRPSSPTSASTPPASPPPSQKSLDLS